MATKTTTLFFTELTAVTQFAKAKRAEGVFVLAGTTADGYFATYTEVK